MDFYEAINRRHIVREWKQEDVSEEAVKRIISAGLKAPTNDHMRSWEFILLHDRKEKEQALQFVREWVEKKNLEGKTDSVLKTPAQKMYAYAMPRQYFILLDAPYVIIPLFKAAADIFHAETVNRLNSFASIWCVIENMFLAATAEGLACSMRIPVGEEWKHTASVLEVPEGYIVPCYIGVGYAAEKAPELEQNTFTVEEKLHLGKW